MKLKIDVCAFPYPTPKTRTSDSAGQVGQVGGPKKSDFGVHFSGKSPKMQFSGPIYKESKTVLIFLGMQPSHSDNAQPRRLSLIHI